MAMTEDPTKQKAVIEYLFFHSNNSYIVEFNHASFPYLSPQQIRSIYNRYKNEKNCPNLSFIVFKKFFKDFTKFYLDEEQTTKTQPTKVERTEIEQDLVNMYKNKSNTINIKKTVTPKKSHFEYTEPTHSFDELSGIDEIISDFMLHTEFSLSNSNTLFYLICGPSGCGKTAFVEAVSKKFDFKLLKVPVFKLCQPLDNDTGEYIAKLTQFLSNSTANTCVLFDDLDRLFKKSDSESGSVAAMLSNWCDEIRFKLKIKEINLIVFATATFVDCIDVALRRGGRFEHEINLNIPSFTKRKQILTQLMNNQAFKNFFVFVQNNQQNIDALARSTPGYSPADLLALLNHIHFQHFKTKKNHFDFVMDEVKRFVPSSQKLGFVNSTNTSWSDIGGMEHLKNELNLTMLGPLLFKDKFEALGLDKNISNGVLLIGPPGTGKTLIAKAVANEAALNFISVRGPEVLSMYVGESERAIREIFSRAQNSSPCVIFFDEIDSICVNRAGEDSGKNHSARLVNQLLTEMDGLHARKDVFVLAATNRPDILDPAVLRPGRFDKIYYIGFPNLSQRKSILLAVTKNGTRPAINPRAIDYVTNLTENYTGADLTALVRQCAMNIIRDERRADLVINEDDVFLALQSFKRSTDEKLANATRLNVRAAQLLQVRNLKIYGRPLARAEPKHKEAHLVYVNEDGTFQQNQYKFNRYAAYDQVNDILLSWIVYLPYFLFLPITGFLLVWQPLIDICVD